MNEPLKVKVILGSTRQGRFGEQPAKWVMEQLKGREDIAAELLDLRDYPMPFFDEAITPNGMKEPYTNPVVQKWTAKIAEGEAFIILTPEYNHAYPAVLKNAIDYVAVPWHKKPVGFVSWGTVGGVRAVQQLRQVVVELQMAPIRAGVHIVAPYLLPKDDNGLLKAGTLDYLKDGTKVFFDQLVWWGNALKTARKNTA